MNFIIKNFNTAHCPDNREMINTSNDHDDCTQLRCECGRLILKKSHKGYEFKCPRCKKVHMLSYEQMISEYLTMKKASHVENKAI